MIRFVLKNELNAHDFYQQPLPSLIPLPKLVDDLNVKEFDTICTLLNLEMIYDWRWLAGEVKFTRSEMKSIESSTGNHSKLFMDNWCGKGATTSQLLTLLAGKRVDIIQELAKSYIIP